MLNRRHLRIKVMQALYAYQQSKTKDTAIGEKELFHSLEKVYDLYIFMLLTFEEVRKFAASRIEDRKKKRLPTKEDLNPNTRFIDNRVFEIISTNTELTRLSETRKINWGGEQELFKKLFRVIEQSDEYNEYMVKEEDSFKSDREFALKIFKVYVANFESLQQLLEDKSIYWVDDLDLVCSMVLRTIKSMHENVGENAKLMAMYKDPEEEIKFVKDLFWNSIKNHDTNMKLVEEKAKNWELDRIAAMDILLMNMALTEVKIFSTIPVKVSLNEYIEISKFYSTPKSNIFINGILDKLFEEMKKSGVIKKMGRGLIE